MFSLRATLLLSLTLLSFVPVVLRSQTDTGTMTGTARDTSGAVLTGVKIEISDVRTNAVVFTTTTDMEGRYVAPALKPSDYELTAELAGFKKAVRKGVNLAVSQMAEVDLTLEVGQVSEVLEVTAAATLMHTESAELGDVVEHKRVVELPLNGRFFVNLVPLTVGRPTGR
jgi:hypothetical protein